MMIGNEIAALFILSVPVACISWTVTHEEIFSEIKKYCVQCSNESKSVIKRKFFYLFTCEYCFSHYVTILFILLTNYTLLLEDWRGYVIAGFSLVWIANFYMSLFGRIRIDIKKEQTEIKVLEEDPGKSKSEHKQE